MAKRVLMAGGLVVCLALGVLVAGYQRVWWGAGPERDAAAVVLRVRFLKGMPGPALSRPVPDITVYGNGRLVWVRLDGASEVLMEGRLGRAALRRVRRDARMAGLGTPRTFRPDEQVLDGGATEVTFVGRRSKVPAGAGGVRVWLIERLVEGLRTPSRDDLVRPPAGYRPERVAVVAARPMSGSGPVRAWPLGPLGAGCSIRTGPEASAALGVPAAPGTRWRSGRGMYAVDVRPLLPDEGGCAAVVPP